MCFAPKPNKTVNQQVATPEKVTEAPEVGSARKDEDEDLFGGVPNLRTDRTTPPQVSNAGSGLNLM